MTSSWQCHTLWVFTPKSAILGFVSITLRMDRSMCFDASYHVLRWYICSIIYLWVFSHTILSCESLAFMHRIPLSINFCHYAGNFKQAWHTGWETSEMISTVYPKKYAHGFVVLCFVVVMQSFIMNSHEVFIHIHQGCFAGTGAIVRLPQCQWSNPDGYGKISQCITTTKHSKAKTVCIFPGIYCMHYDLVKCSVFLNGITIN